MIEGGCLCGAIRYEIDGTLGTMTHCHCSMCRKTHGAAFATFAGVATDRFRWTRGQAELRRYRSSSNVDRVFCGACGSNLQFVWLPIRERVWIAAGTFDGDPGVRASAHIFVASKAPWFDITDALPQHAEDRPA